MNAKKRSACDEDFRQVCEREIVWGGGVGNFLQITPSRPASASPPLARVCSPEAGRAGEGAGLRLSRGEVLEV